MSGRKKKKVPSYPLSSFICYQSDFSKSPFRNMVLGAVGFFCKKGEEEMKGRRKAAVGGLLLVSFKKSCSTILLDGLDETF